jgi:dTDP-4-amino-4,6-dideoxygalactose transaminase
MLTNDKYCRILENKIEKMYNVDYVLTTSSCTQGLMLCLNYMDPRFFQVSMFNWWSDLYLFKFLKIDPIWDDIDIENWLPLEKQRIQSLYLHTFGNIGRSKYPDAIYDASHCLGAKLEDIGLASVISLAPTKLITSCEGGLILTNNENLYEQCKEWRDKMCRMSELHAKVGLETLKSLDKVKKWKKKVFEYYKKNIPGQFQEIPNNSNYNTIGFLNTEKLEIPEHITYKQYYEPIYNRKNSNSQFVYDNIVCLPSYYNCNYKKIVEDVLNENNR